MKLRLTDDGVIVADLKANSPADKAEMRVGDTVKKINAAPIATIDDARKILGDTSPDNPLEVEVVRSGKTLNFKLTPETK
jgi:S1-C subfamily serine protease